MTLDEFHAWCDEGTRAEWVDGEVVVFLPTSIRHHKIVQLLVILLRLWVDAKGLGELYSEMILMRLFVPARRERLPDIMFVASEHLGRIQPTYLDGPADLVVEVVSPDSVGRDRGDKFIEYEQAGIPEYWLIDPGREQAELYELSEDGRYQLALGGRNGIYHSKALQGFPLNLEWLWQDPPPKPLELVRQLGLLTN